jgi:DNA-binding MarR family transcriptional regulator
LLEIQRKALLLSLIEKRNRLLQFFTDYSSITDCLILDFVGNHPEKSYKDVADFLGVTPSAISQKLSVLHTAGLLISKPGKDRRERLVSISEQGQKRSEQLAEFFNELQIPESIRGN